MTLTETVRNAGIIGAGGAGFPTHVKLASKPEFIIVNGAECEPLLMVDREICLRHADELLQALELVRSELGAAHAYYALKEKYREAVDALEKNIAKYPAVSIHLLPNIYPAGDEQVLVYEVTKRIVPEGGIPLAVGCVVLNVETLFNIYRAVYENAPVTDKYVTITGAVRTPMTLKVPVGTVVSELLGYCGVTEPDFKVIDGGPMMGKIVEDTGAPVTKTTKGLIVLPSSHPRIAAKERPLSSMMHMARSACCHCSECTEVCPRALLGHSIHPDKMMRIASYNKVCDATSSVTETFLCCECGLCEIACVMNLQPWKLHHELKGKLIASGIKNPHKNAPEAAHPFREYRRFPESKLVARLGLSKYEVEAPLKEDHDFRPARVILNLKQSAGAPAIPQVSVGDRVGKGDLVGEIPEKALGSRLHASVTGKVVSVDEKSICIETLQEEK